MEHHQSAQEVEHPADVFPVAKTLQPDMQTMDQVALLVLRDRGTNAAAAAGS
jgi:hypothetical protein